MIKWLAAAALFLPVAFDGRAPQTAATPQGDTIPKELVSVLLKGPGAYPGESFDLKLGPPPADFPKDVLPQGTIVALTAVSDRSVTVVGTAASFTPAMRDPFLGGLQTAGWTNAMPVQRGFTMGGSNQPLSVCRDHDFVTLSFIPRAEGGNYVRASLSRDPRRQCIARPMGMESFFADINVPSLAPPPDAKGSGGGGGGGSDSWRSEYRIVVKMDVPAIAAHYRAQLVEAGWKVQGKPVEVDGLSLTHFLVPSKAGGNVAGLLTVMTLPGDPQIDLMLRVVRPSDNRFGRAGSTGLTIIR